jgi:hypothetical protein
MRRLFLATCIAAAAGLSAAHLGAQAAKAKPANATAECTDGTWSTAKSQQGACSGHGGVKTWFGSDSSGKGAKAEAKSKAEPKTKAAPKSESAPAAKTTTAPAKDTSTTAAKTASPAPKKDAAPAATKESAPKAAKGSAAKSSTGAATIARPAGAPADATGQCNDGTYTKAQNHQGACSGHDGVKGWF